MDTIMSPLAHDSPFSRQYTNSCRKQTTDKTASIIVTGTLICISNTI